MSKAYSEFFANMDWRMLYRQKKVIENIPEHTPLVKYFALLMESWFLFADETDEFWKTYINWKLLRDGKLKLVKIQSSLNEKQQDAIEGFLNGLDSFQDIAVDVLGLKKEDVFIISTD